MHTTPRKEAETRHLPKTCDEPPTITNIAPATPKKIPNIHSVVVEYSRMPASFKIETNTTAGAPRSNDTVVSSTSGRCSAETRCRPTRGKVGVYRAVSRKARVAENKEPAIHSDVVCTQHVVLFAGFFYL
jgi:hypothetical protein